MHLHILTITRKTTDGAVVDKERSPYLPKYHGVMMSTSCPQNSLPLKCWHMT